MVGSGAAMRQYLRRLLLACVATLSLPSAFAQVPTTPWVLVDTRLGALVVYSATGRTLATFRNISIGRGGTARVHYRNDRSTPLGTYRVVDIRQPHRFDTLMLLNYPTAAQADLALADGRLVQTERDAIARAEREARLPPQTTALGGGIAIHGLGRGDPRIHQAFNWTAGCVALSNGQVRSLAQWVDVGTRVVIR
jgi:hypothetical protein